MIAPYKPTIFLSLLMLTACDDSKKFRVTLTLQHKDASYPASNATADVCIPITISGKDHRGTTTQTSSFKCKTVQTDANGVLEVDVNSSDLVISDTRFGSDHDIDEDGDAQITLSLTNAAFTVLAEEGSSEPLQLQGHLALSDVLESDGNSTTLPFTTNHSRLGQVWASLDQARGTIPFDMHSLKVVHGVDDRPGVGGKYTQGTRTITIDFDFDPGSGFALDADEYFNDMIWHEYGHAVMHAAGHRKATHTSDSCPSHKPKRSNGTSDADLACSMSEGWADFVALYVRNELHPGSSTEYRGYELEDYSASLTGVPGGYEDEGRVAAALWDLYDAMDDCSFDMDDPKYGFRGACDRNEGHRLLLADLASAFPVAHSAATSEKTPYTWITPAIYFDALLISMGTRDGYGVEKIVEAKEILEYNYMLHATLSKRATAEVLVAVEDTAGPSSESSGYPRAQSFRHEGGNLSAVDLHFSTPVTKPWEIRVLTALPDGNGFAKIDSSTLDGLTVAAGSGEQNTEGWTLVPLTSEADLDAGTYYLFVDSETAGTGPTGRWSIREKGQANDDYKDGEGWVYVYDWSNNSNEVASRDSSVDRAFRLYR